MYPGYISIERFHTVEASKIVYLGKEKFGMEGIDNSKITKKIPLTVSICRTISDQQVTEREIELIKLQRHNHSNLFLWQIQVEISETCANCIDYDTKKVRISLPHPFVITSVLCRSPDMLIVGDAEGGLFCWKLDLRKEDLQPILLWATRPFLNCQGTCIEEVHNLSELNKKLMSQHGALD